MRSRADVVVIGGGIIGCSTALGLARAGADVLLLERAEIASAASGRNHGLIFYPQNEIAEPLYRKSFDIYRDIAANSEVNIGMDDRPRGLVVAVSSEDEWEAAELEAKASEVGGVEINRLSEKDLMDAEPNIAPGHLGGYYIDDGYRLDPAALTTAVALEARRAGAEVLTHTDVKQIIVNLGRVEGVVTDEGIVRTQAVVDSAGPWASKLVRPLGIDLPIVGARGWLLLTQSIDPITNHLIERSGWHQTSGDPGPAQVTVHGFAEGKMPVAADIGLVVQQNATGHVLLGGSRLASMREDPEGYEVTLEIAQRAVATVPKLAEVPLIGVWSGVRPMSLDGLPLIGWAPGVEGLFICGGHGGQGVMLGGGSGQLGADLITKGDAFTDPEPFALSRFEGGRTARSYRAVSSARLDFL